MRTHLPGTEILLILGGDGTILRAVSALATTDVPLLGVNTGKVGFLARAEADQLEAVLGQVRDGTFEVESRMALQVTVVPAPDGATATTAAHYVALNEAAIVRGSSPRLIRLDVAIDETHLATYRADGLVVATPTGSTGYSFSAGGPILDPGSRNLVVTPIAAYLAGIHSIVVSPRHTVTVRVEAAYDVMVSIDGQTDLTLAVGDSIRVHARERPIRFMQPHGTPSFWDLLRRKVELLPP
ncbi:MAG TPA: NAD(+)/NADH kinase [Candidatus Baltobacteraceae bacterium]|nr:NAD(+)/NADH kinase [Candidatus Baltobacteraceae bacterium]